MTVVRRSPFTNLALIGGLACLTAALPSPALGAEATATVTCRNPVSGASWQITVDFGTATVDSYPAKISQAEISWFDPKDLSTNRLDRKTGNLTTSIASSTGGYFRPGRCDAEKLR